jgi:cellobiose phosphorylase
MKQRVDGWKFLNNNGDFTLVNPDKTSYLYFPLANEAGMMSSISPRLNGDIKSGQNTFLMTPVSVEDLHNTRSGRNFWVYVEGKGPWSAAGNSSAQMGPDLDESSQMEAGFLWHKVTRMSRRMGLKSEITSFIPATEDRVELMKVVITNIGQEALTLTPTAAIPIFGRSADNLRDHRHVTSLLHRIDTRPLGIEVQPTLSFDERGHRRNRVAYGVFGAGPAGEGPTGFFPILEDFIGEGGHLEWPEAVLDKQIEPVKAGIALEGYEAIGALRFRDQQLMPGQSVAYVMMMAIRDDGPSLQCLAEKYCLDQAFDHYLVLCKTFWHEKLDGLAFRTGDIQFEPWMKWVTVQPILRRIFGCSFLPHHDYGRGGRGWRDLWQDCLALLMMDPTGVRDLLVNNYAGVRIDGSNATIIGNNPGEFIADRNNISRVWMDHGAWPFLTTKLYIDLSGDLDFLFQTQAYFKDAQIYRGKARDDAWRPEDGNKLKTVDGQVYEGTILEHILLQNLTSFFNVGDHNNIRLEDADWNDGLDMAGQKGESVAFTAFYGYNLAELAALLEAVKEKKNLNEVELAEEVVILLHTLAEAADYDSVAWKRSLLQRFFEAGRSRISGRKVKISIDALVADLRRKADWIGEHIRTNEWIGDNAGYRWFNGYYDNDGVRVEGDHPLGVRMTLTGQVFTIMGGIADEEQIRQVVQATDRYLLDPVTGGYRLNTNFHEVKMNMGRCFGFAYGQKENGAVFSHMAIMYGNALYKRGFVREGYKVLQSLYELSANFEQGRVYPGIPEYFNGRGRGMYHYLTGSASWYLLTVLSEVFGVKGCLGDLAIEPKLLPEQFGAEGVASVRTSFAGRQLEIEYHNPQKRPYGEYRILGIKHNGEAIEWKRNGVGAILERSIINTLDSGQCHRFEVELG